MPTDVCPCCGRPYEEEADIEDDPDEEEIPMEYQHYQHKAVTAEKRQEILDVIDDTESRFDITIIYAVESGSRTWGFHSADSDYDVRFIYMHNDPAHYRSLFFKPEADHLCFQAGEVGDIDMEGWGIGKALRLMAKCNPSLLEWLHSPIVYTCDVEKVALLDTLAGTCYSKSAMVHHYLGMAKRNWTAYLDKEGWVSRKKYLYVVRPVLAARYILETDPDLGAVVAPSLFSNLLGLAGSYGIVPIHVENDISRLVADKMAGMELGKGPQIRDLHDWLAKSLERIDVDRRSLPGTSTKYVDVDRIYQQLVFGYAPSPDDAEQQHYETQSEEAF